jgi:hypothetical protein
MPLNVACAKGKSVYRHPETLMNSAFTKVSDTFRGHFSAMVFDQISFKSTYPLAIAEFPTTWLR